MRLPCASTHDSSNASGAESGRSRSRGFTLVEVIVVVIIIAVLATLAIPSISQRMRDRRVRQVAEEVATLYRNARMRAMGRGSAVLVRFNPGTSGSGRIEIREAIEGSTAVARGGDAKCAPLPTSGCLTNTWANAGSGSLADNQQVTFFEPGIRSEFANIEIVMAGPSTASGTQTQMDVCFTPLGSAYIRFSASSPFQRMVGVPVATISRHDENDAQVGLARSVMILPNGTSRLAL